MTAGLAPLFTSAPRLKIKIDGVHVAYAIGFSLNISVDVQPVQVIGQFGLMSLEPTMYNTVTGTMQIIPLVTGTTKAAQLGAAAGLVNPLIDTTTTTTTKDSTGKETVTTATSLQVSSKADNESILSINGLYRHLDPTKVLSSRTFDMQLCLVVPTIVAPTTAIDGELTLNGTEEVWLTLKYCRLVSRNTNVAHGQLVNSPVNFQALLATPNDSDFSLDSLTKEKLG